MKAKLIFLLIKMFLFSTKDGKYLTADNNLSDNIENAFLFNFENVSFKIVRFKFGNKYLAANSEIYFTENKSDDATLFLKWHGRYVSIKKEVISLCSTPNKAICKREGLEEYEISRYPANLEIERFDDLKLSIEREKETKEERDKREEKEMQEYLKEEIEFRKK